MILVDALPRVRFEHRGSGLFHLQKNGVVVLGQKERNAAQRADAPHAHDFDRDIHQSKPIEETSLSSGKVSR